MPKTILFIDELSCDAELAQKAFDYFAKQSISSVIFLQGKDSKPIVVPVTKKTTPMLKKVKFMPLSENARLNMIPYVLGIAVGQATQSALGGLATAIRPLAGSMASFLPKEDAMEEPDVAIVSSTLLHQGEIQETGVHSVTIYSCVGDFAPRQRPTMPPVSEDVKAILTKIAKSKTCKTRVDVLRAVGTVASEVLSDHQP